MSRIIAKRTRYFLAVEGSGEQSFITWLQRISDEVGLNIHLDCEPLNGGGYETMLERAVKHRLKRERHSARASLLLVDADRSSNNDWSTERLREKAASKDFQLILQNPNQEGLLLRMIPGNEQLRPGDGPAAYRQLLSAWPQYEKPVNARKLALHFTLSDLARTATADPELRLLLEIIGLLP